MGSHSGMKIIIAITFLLSLIECRRHLCDDHTRPVCPDGTQAVYNRPTGKNSRKSKYFPPPVCHGKGRPKCLDGSVAKYRFNTCSNEEKKCPKGQGQGQHDRPFSPCADGSPCKCPGRGKGCQFQYRRCSNGKKCRPRCRSGVPHCPWLTKNRNPHNGTRIYNTGPNRPGNKKRGHDWGIKHLGNMPRTSLGCEIFLRNTDGTLNCARINPNNPVFDYLCTRCCADNDYKDNCPTGCDGCPVGS